MAVIAHRPWIREFGADPAVLGRAIRVADQDVVIIGVAPDGFAGVDLRVGRAGPDVWLPMPLVDRVAQRHFDLRRPADRRPILPLVRSAGTVFIVSHLRRDALCREQPRYPPADDGS